MNLYCISFQRTNHFKSSLKSLWIRDLMNLHYCFTFIDFYWMLWNYYFLFIVDPIIKFKTFGEIWSNVILMDKPRINKTFLNSFTFFFLQKNHFRLNWSDLLDLHTKNLFAKVCSMYNHEKAKRLSDIRNNSGITKRI